MHFFPTDDLGRDQEPIGLLLGAGGIRGCAHAGVLKVMNELGLSADVVVGASIGSLFGAAYAAGWSADRIGTLAYQAPHKAVAEFYLNRLRIDRTTYIGSILSQLGRQTRIEELPKPFACMAFDCESGEIVALRKGPLLESLQASIALPGIAKPVNIGGRAYLDGGLKGRVPASVARSMGARLVIRVELSGRYRLWYPLGRRYRLAMSRIFMKRVITPSIGATARSALEPSISTRPSDDADLTISPGFYGLFCNSPVGIKFCARRGEAAARREIVGLRGREGMMRTRIDILKT